MLLYPFIGLYSADFADSQIYIRKELVLLFSLAGLLQSLRLPGLTVICAAGHYKQTQTRAILEAAINILISLALVGRYGLAGVMTGICVSYLYRTADVIIYTAKHFVQDTLGQTVKRLVCNTVLLVAMVYLGLRFVPQQMKGWISWFSYAVAYGVMSCITFVGANMVIDSKERQSLLLRVKDLMRR